ncbi:protein kinase [Streptomyces sp. NPDC006602]|uniref:serine/threonine-protein kinase n=1 Tax=Streptomyces sp. NPDC006602 TaxID=3364751 RepID=UPI003682412E
MGEVFAGRYELADPIGRGGVGAVWRAWDHRRRRYVAAKVLQQSDAHALLRFVREQALRIDHPHVLAPASWAADDDKVLFTMDLVAGGSLVHLIGDYGPLPPAFVCTLLDQLLAGLAAVHAEGVVHRDIKPANVLLEATGTGRPRLRLSDFGIAMRLGEPRLTETNLVVGTPGYLAPEQMMGAEPDFPADLFGVGLTALYLLEGAKPDSKALIQYFTAHGTPSAPQGIPDPLWQVVASLLQPDPHARFRTATGARKALASAAELLPEPGPDDETIEIFDQLGPLPPGFAPTGPLKRAPGVETGATSRWPAEGASRSRASRSAVGAFRPAEAEVAQSAEGPRSVVGAAGSAEGPWPAEGPRSASARPLEIPRPADEAARSEEGHRSEEEAPASAEGAAAGSPGGGVSSIAGESAPSRPGEGPPSRPEAPGIPFRLGPEEGHAASRPENGPSGSGSRGTAPVARQSNAPRAARPGTESLGPAPGMGSTDAHADSGHVPPTPGTGTVLPPEPSTANPVGLGAEAVSPDHRQGAGPTSPPVGGTPSRPAFAPARPTTYPRPPAPPQPPTMSDTGSFHLPPPQTTASPSSPQTLTPQPHQGQPQPQAQTQAQPHPASPAQPLNVSPHDPTHVLSSPQPHTATPHYSPRTPTTAALRQRAEPSTASYTAQAPQVPPPAQSISQPRHRAPRSARRAGPPAKVAIPLLLLALACYAVGFWALSHI